VAQPHRCFAPLPTSSKKWQSMNKTEHNNGNIQQRNPFQLGSRACVCCDGVHARQTFPSCELAG
jgi:hypothetical protein